MAYSTPEDLTQDGSLLKTVLCEGDGEEAGRGARVAVRYSLRLSEEKGSPSFDSSAKRKDGVLEFTLGRNKVIPALELLAQSMKHGEKCTARAAAPYAFGARGLKRKAVPPHAPIFLDVEMVRFEGGQKKKPVADMTPAERFAQAKTCKETGNNFFKEQKYDKALNQYSQGIRYLANVFYKPSSTLADPVAKPVGADKPVAVHAEGPSAEQTGKNISNDQANGGPSDSGFEQAEIIDSEDIPTPSRQEKHETTEAYTGGRTVEQKDETIEAGIKAKKDENVENVTSETVQPGFADGLNEDEEVIETIDVSTAHGPTVQSFMGATRGAQEPVESQTTQPDESDTAEEQATEIEEQSEETEDPEEEEVRALHVTTLNNLSLCFVKLEDYKRAKESASLALKIDSNSSKALYYRARAEIALGEWETAQVDLQAAAQIQPKNLGIRNEIIKLDRKMKHFQEREKRQAAAMFA